MPRFACLVFFACSSGPPPAEHPTVSSAVSTDASIDAAPDAGLPDTVTSAPRWVFRYNTPERTETWTLQFAEGIALVVVASTRGELRYVGSATEGTTLALAVATSTAKLALDCKRTKRPLGVRCNDRKARPVGGPRLLPPRLQGADAIWRGARHRVRHECGMQRVSTDRAVSVALRHGRVIRSSVA